MIKLRKILYIYPQPLKQQEGSDRVNIRNRELIEQTGINTSVYLTSPTNKIQTFCRLLLGFCGGMDYANAYKIFSMLDSDEYDMVFLWSSKLGKLAKMISRRYPDIKIITFFHNIEIQYYEEEMKLAPNLKNRFISHIVCKNEADAIRYSTSLVVMNERDNRLLKQYYNVCANLILPLGMTDSYRAQIDKNRFDDVTSRLKLLFVGSAFFANVNGVQWFIDYVFPKLKDVELLIVGKGMDGQFSSVEDCTRNCKISVTGYVEKLSEIYDWCHIVISPIFLGGGMKTKTAEAMMYGCPIIGTAEAFEGYDVVYDRIGAKCDTADDFVNAICRLKEDRKLLLQCASYARDIFLEKYDTNALKGKMTDFLQNLTT